MTQTSIIQTKNLIKIYGKDEAQVVALAGIDLTIDANEFVAIMGPSGSGKSTLMNILGCLDQPSSGNYLLAGEEVSHLDREELARIRNEKLGFIFQSYNLLPNTSAIENVLLPLLYQRKEKLTYTQQKEKALEGLIAVGLENRAHHQPNELSGGQMQRVAIARALINDPTVILADEPTGNLDTHSSKEVIALLQELHRQGRTIVMVTHNEEIAACAERIIRFRDGLIESDEKVGLATA